VALRIDGDFSQKLTDITINWKALEEHFLMAPLVFRLNHVLGKIAFSEFLKALSVTNCQAPTPSPQPLHHPTHANKQQPQYFNCGRPRSLSLHEYKHWC
jgi:hypothetical protein